MTQDSVDAGLPQQTVAAQRPPSLGANAANPTPPTLAVLSTSSLSGNPSSATASTTSTGSTKDNVMMPSGTSLAIMPPAGATSSQNASTSVVPVHVAAGIGVGFPMPHPGDGSMDFSKTEMVTPETSLNMSIAAFLSRYTFKSKDRECST